LDIIKETVSILILILLLDHLYSLNNSASHTRYENFKTCRSNL